MKKVVFVSNFFNHHQSDFCDEMLKLSEFYFIATERISEERLKLGYLDESPWFLIDVAKSPEKTAIAKQLIIDADYVIFGSAPFEFIKERKALGKIIFQYSERIFKNGTLRLFFPYIAYRYRKMFRGENMYLLCASAYAYSDFRRIGLYKDKAYNWGYFPKIERYSNVEKLIANKEKNSILWVGRLIDWKHPDYAIKLAKKLFDEGYDFQLNIVGTGFLDDILQQNIVLNHLEDRVHLLGSMTPNMVRQTMTKSEIFIFTSDYNEGWGAVLNEAMNSACAVVANSAIGSVPFMINDHFNGMIYKNGDLETFYSKVALLLQNEMLRREMSQNAYDTIIQSWNSKIAAERFLTIANDLEISHVSTKYNKGICSKAKLFDNRGYKEMYNE